MEKRGVYRVLVGRTEGRRSGQGPVAGFCEDGNEPFGSIKKAGYCLTS
jgi:hypothetical protein